MAYKTPRLSGSSTSRRDRSSMYSEGSEVGPIRGVTDGASSILSDAFDLLELQTRLLLVDSQECLRKAKYAALGLIITLAVLIASLPVVALGLAHLLAWATAWPLWVNLLMVGVLFSASGVALGFWCTKRLLGSLSAFRSTMDEAEENLRWLRNALTRSFAS